MPKKYVVRLSDAARSELVEVVKKLKGTSQKVKRAQVLLQADADGPAWMDAKIAEAYSCRTRTIEKLRQRLVERGFEETLNGKTRQAPPVEKRLNGEQEAQVIATRLGPRPKGCANWSLRLLARRVVALEIVGGRGSCRAAHASSRVPWLAAQQELRPPAKQGSTRIPSLDGALVGNCHDHRLAKPQRATRQLRRGSPKGSCPPVLSRFISSELCFA